MNQLLKQSTPLLFAAASLFADGFSCGLRINGALPLGVLKTDEVGGTHKSLSAGLGGIHLAYAFQPRDEVALSFNAVGWKGNPTAASLHTQTINDYVFHQVGVEWRHRLPNDSAFGLVGGVHVSKMKRDLTVQYSDSLGSFGSTYHFTQSQRPGVKVGVFYQPERWFSVEGSIQHVALDKQAASNVLPSATWLQVSAVFHFGNSLR